MIKKFGKKKIESEEPLRASLKDGIWTVLGTMPPADPGAVRIGGVVSVRLAEADGRVLEVSHGE
jgi:hypothetical protein